MNYFTSFISWVRCQWSQGGQNTIIDYPHFPILLIAPFLKFFHRPIQQVHQIHLVKLPMCNYDIILIFGCIDQPLMECCGSCKGITKTFPPTRLIEEIEMFLCLKSGVYNRSKISPFSFVYKWGFNMFLNKNYKIMRIFLVRHG